MLEFADWGFRMIVLAVAGGAAMTVLVRLVLRALEWWFARRERDRA